MNRQNQIADLKGRIKFRILEILDQKPDRLRLLDAAMRKASFDLARDYRPPAKTNGNEEARDGGSL